MKPQRMGHLKKKDSESPIRVDISGADHPCEFIRSGKDKLKNILTIDKMTNHPPKLAQSFLLRFLRDDLAEEVLGDLEEKFYVTLKNKSLLKAKLNYWYQVFNYLRPFAIRKSKAVHHNHYDMFQNYFKIGWRNLSKQKMYSSIKIGGFALGIAACILIAMFIRDELNYDLHYPDKDRIYRVVGIWEDEGKKEKGAFFPAPLAKALKEDFPEIEKAGRFNQVSLFGAGSNEVRRADQQESYYEEGFTYGDQDLLDILQIPMISGSREHALLEPKTIVISKRKADKYFPDEDPIGKDLILNNREDRRYTIKGVMEDFPATMHVQYDFIMTLAGIDFYPGEQENWYANNYFTYILLRPDADPDHLADKLKSLVKSYYLPTWLNAGVVDATERVDKLSFELQPITDIHLKSEGIHDRLSHGDIRFVWLFGAVAGFILIIACINFINLSTAKSANRAKEVGLRKVVGSFRINLINQFLTESLLFSFFSFAVGILLAWVLLPYFNTLALKSLIFPWVEWWLLPLLLLAAVIIGFFAGLYPSFYLSSFKPIQVLKGNISKGSKSSGTRSFLVVFQFTISIILIIGTIIIYRQMQFILNKKVGFDKDQVVMIHGTNTLGEQILSFKDELLQLPQVRYASISDYLPIIGSKRNGNGFFKEGKTQEDKPVYGEAWRVDHDYIKTMGMKIVEGRDFSRELASDSQAVVINQAMVSQLGLENPIGKRITNRDDPVQVIGVVEDFHFESMKGEIKPVCLFIGRSPSIVSVKVNAENMSGLLRSIGEVWKKFAPHQPIRYTFMDESFARSYEDVQRMGNIFTSFTILAIIIACLGLFALSAFMVEQRGKEISIRLVLGASANNIFGLLTQNFLKLVLIAFAIGAPMAWYMMKKWLEDYEYKIDISWDVFLIAGIASAAIALFTISYQSIHAALMHPVKNLKAE